MLPKSARAAIFGSMAPIGVPSGTDIITQGDEGTKFYILERGTCDVLVAKEEWGPQPRKVLSYSPGRSVPAAAFLQSFLHEGKAKKIKICSSSQPCPLGGLFPFSRDIKAH